MTLRSLTAILVASLLVAANVSAQSALDDRVAHELDSLVTTYKALHANPELSGHEEKTAAVLARELRALGYEVTEGIGKYAASTWRGYGVVALMRNGEGPTLLVRADMDALPVEEKTG